MTLNCKSQLISLDSPKVMGILNCTPDSFYDGGKLKDTASVLRQTQLMLDAGATFIDLGAYSSRPGADFVSEDEELQRIIPIVEALIRAFPEILLSIDTFRSKVADRCLGMGAAMINDISGGNADKHMYQVVANYSAPYVLMHMKGTPKTMQQQTQYQHLITDILYYFSDCMTKARSFGINDIIVDPGFGFAKTLEQNYAVLKELQLFKTLEVPILVGLSRKSMIYKLLDSTPDNALNGTTALNFYALCQGANILRVHDVKEAQECVQLVRQLLS